MVKMGATASLGTQVYEGMKSMQLRRVVATENGVFQPPFFMLEGGLLLVALLFIVMSIALGRASVTSALPSFVVLTAFAVVRLVVYRKHGTLGKPSVAVQGHTLVLALPWDLRGQLRFALSELQELIVYGRIGRRIYRFVRRDGTYLEVVPEWRPRVEKAAVEFLLRRLPSEVRVTVAEPQTLFASIRGDGP